ncbi:MAG: hypothetical protein DYG92_05485 [Leptolyngbya sp. PLA1]|nr:hypothetical protein [Leptolyngbya sp. PLA1]
MKRAKLCLMLVLACGCPGLACVDRAAAQTQPERGAKVNLRPRFEKGQELRYTMIIESSTVDSQAGEPQSSSQEIGLLLRCTKSDPESGYTLDLVYESLKMKVRSPLATIEFDSTRPAKADDPADAALRTIVGLTLPVTMDKDGNISSVGAGDAVGGAMSALVGQFSGGDMIRGMFGPIMTGRKGTGEASVGESWTNDDVIDGPAGQMKISLTHTLDSHSGGKATIPMRGKVTLSPSSGATGKVAIRDSSISGKTVWDTGLGQLVSLESRQRVVVDSNHESQTSSQTQEMNVRVTRRK